MKKKKQIFLEDVQAMLVDGKTRDQIGQHYELNGVETKKLFSHPELKGKRTHKPVSFEVVSRKNTESKELATNSSVNEDSIYSQEQ